MYGNRGGGMPPSGPRGGNNGYNSYSPQPNSRQHQGLGSTQQHYNQSRPGHLPAQPAFQPALTTAAPLESHHVTMSGNQLEKFSLFVGSIVQGVENVWLERILQVAGPILSFRRPSPPFAFVEYSDPESVIRCLEVVNGCEIKTKEGNQGKLAIKADEKTRKRLDEYEQTRILSEANSDLTLQAKEDLVSILARIAAGDSASAPLPSSTGSSAPTSSSSDPTAAAKSDEASAAGQASDQALAEANRLANHLKDLAPEDLPDSLRKNTLSSIAAFRERAQRKQVEKRELDRQIEERRLNVLKNRQQQQQQQQGQNPNNHYNSQGRYNAGQQQQQQQQGGQPIDPQSFNQPIGFVSASGSNASNDQAPKGDESKVEPEIDDAKRERERAEKEHRQQEMIFKDRERRFEQRERGRLQALEREKIRERSIIEQEDRDRTFMAERLATWDDEREADRGRELFYVDRIRWRTQRRMVRQREEEFDHRDRILEAQRQAQIAQQSESFLSQHADLFADPSASASVGKDGVDNASGEGAGGGVGGTAAVKLSFGSTAISTKPKTTETVAPKRSAVLGLAEDDDEEGRRKRELIPLSYSDDEGDNDEEKKKSSGQGTKTVMSSRERERKMREIEDKVPRDKDGLFGWKIRWSNLTEDILTRRISPFTNKRIVEYLGGEEAELVNAVLEHLRAHKPAQDLVDELEPVLDEESTDLVVKVWKVVITETEFAHAGL